MSANSDIYKHIADIEKAMSEIQLSDKKIKWYLAALIGAAIVNVGAVIIFIGYFYKFNT